MSFRVYGNAGCPIVAFPTQDGMCDQWEGFGMVDILQDRIEIGEIQLFCLTLLTSRPGRTSMPGRSGGRSGRRIISALSLRNFCLL